jgi:hypothetical protein
VGNRFAKEKAGLGYKTIRAAKFKKWARANKKRKERLKVYFKTLVSG